jgi:hypothetical protein
MHVETEMRNQAHKECRENQKKIMREKQCEEHKHSKGFDFSAGNDERRNWFL